MRLSIRQFENSDYDVMADIYTAVDPSDPVTAEALVERHQQRDPKCKILRWICECDGCVIATGISYQEIHEYHPQHFQIMIRVHPNSWGIGAGSLLYDHVVEKLAPFKPTKLSSWADKDQDSGIRFLQNRGFKETYRSRISLLNVSKFDLRPYANLEEDLKETGIRIKTLGELISDPERNQKLYDLEWDISREAPNTENNTRLQLDEFVSNDVENDNTMPDGYFIALDEDKYIGLCSLSKPESDTSAAFQRWTGVRKEYQRRGIAFALKVKTVDFAINRGFSQIETFNDATNLAMISLNEKLGFIEQSTWIRMDKEV